MPLVRAATPPCWTSASNAWRSLLAACLLWLAGCAQPPAPPAGEANAWSGRLALQVEGDAAQSFSAIFELRGSPRAGELILLSPLGNQLAQLSWKDGHAQLTSAQETRSSHSLDTLLQDLTGAQIPVSALFSWLQGQHASAPGWQADLAGLPDGRVLARRFEPAPAATLRIALTR